ncbi:hypothetical protein LCL87_12725 [Rhodococcus hoagii]|nr:hypothetical protein [Prescottella equi]
MPDRSVLPGRRQTKWAAGAVAAIAAVGMAAGGAGVAAADTGSSGSLDTTQTRILTDGLYRVGVDVQPGTYTTAGALPGSLLPCTWTRVVELTSAGILTIEPGTSFTPVTVTIEPGDDAFMTTGCRVWSLAGGPGSVDFGSLGTGSLGS